MAIEAVEVAKTSLEIESRDNITSYFDEDGRQRTGTLVTASVKVITAIIGSGILSLAWAVGELCPIAGPIALLMFSGIACYGATLLADCYMDPANGTRSCTYMDVAKASLGGIKLRLCGIALYGNLTGVTIQYVIAASMSTAAIKRSICFRELGREEGCSTSNNGFMIIFGVIQIILSQLPDFHKLSVLSIMDAVISLAYTCIILGLSVAKVAGSGDTAHTSLAGTAAGVDKVFNTFSAFGDITFAYAFSSVLYEIQDTLPSSDPQRNNRSIMKGATKIGILISTILYVFCGLMGYLAFGGNVPENLLTGFGFYQPLWLVDLANFCVVVHLMVSYQVYSKPIFESVERWRSEQWPNSRFIDVEDHVIALPVVGEFIFSWFRLVWRTAYVILTTFLAMMFPFFADVTGLLGAASFWPLTMYFPTEIFITLKNIPRGSSQWKWMQIMSCACLVISVLAAAGSLRGLITSLQAGKFFDSVSA